MLGIPKEFSVEGFLHRWAKGDKPAPLIDALAKWNLTGIPGACYHCIKDGFGPCMNVSEDAITGWSLELNSPIMMKEEVMEE